MGIQHMLIRRLTIGALTAVILVSSAADARAQYAVAGTGTPSESYVIELSGSVWNPSLFGRIASEQFGIPPTQIDFISDLGYEETRFSDARLVLKAGRRHKLRVQYTPISYSADTTLSRDVVFNGILYPVNVDLTSRFDWKVWRFGYEFDVVARDFGYVGLLFEARYTQMESRLTTVVNNEYTRARAPLPAVGLVARVYPIPYLSITGEISGMKVPRISDKYEASYSDIDVYATVNLLKNLGVQTGWRKMTTYLLFETDEGDLKFQGLWFGGVVRF